MARAASGQRSSRASRAIAPSKSLNLEASSGSPITPVDATKTWFASQSAAEAAYLAVASTASFPRHPVNALALPELTTNALALPWASCLRHHSTGADAVFERVSTPPLFVPSGKSAKSTSVRLAYLIPASAVASRTPAIGGKTASSFGAKGETLWIFAMAARLPFLAVLRIGRHVDGRSFRILIDGFFQLRIDNVDLGRATERLHHGFQLILDQRRHQLFLHFIESGKRSVALVLDLDDMPAELGLNRIGNLAGLQRERRVLERLHHLAARKIAEIAAGLGARAIRALFGKFGKIGAGLELLYDVLRLLLGLDKDMPRAHFGFGRELCDLFVIGCLGLRFGDRFAHLLLVEGIAQCPELVISEPFLEFLARSELALARCLGE